MILETPQTILGTNNFGQKSVLISMLELSLQHLRQDYKQRSFDESDAHANPFTQFAQWFDEALRSELPEPNAMSLATVSADGQPSARIVLLKGVDPSGFVFYTNYDSHKAKEAEAQGKVALCFVWLELERQVRIEGTVERVSHAESVAYFQSRPKSSQIGAWASPQSEVLPSRQWLEERQKELEAQYAHVDVLPMPEHWGGYRVLPKSIEFWQGRRSRLHDRIRYTLQADHSWKIERLAP